MIFVAIWIYQSAIKNNTGKAIMWASIAAGVFMVSQFLLVEIQVYLLEAFRGGDGDANYERDLSSVGDRKNEGGFQTGGGAFLSIILEFLPPGVGFILAGVIRAVFMLKQGISLNTLFGGVTDVFTEAFQAMLSSFKEGIKK
ncbi:hypothetical protein [Methylosoma difficile]